MIRFVVTLFYPSRTELLKNNFEKATFGVLLINPWCKSRSYIGAKSCFFTLAAETFCLISTTKEENGQR